MKRMKMLLIAGAAMLATGAMGATYAAYQSSVTVENHIAMGDINVGLAQYQKQKDGTETSYKDPGIVLPGDVVSQIPRFTCVAEPCYIRAHLTFEQDKGQEGLTEKNLSGISDDWIKAGDYYYYKQILDTEQSADLYQSVSIPAEWTSDHELQNLGVIVQVDAIQAANYKPDFSSETPWGDEEIEVCAHTGYEKDIVNPYTTMYVEFEGNSHKLLAVPEDFFSNLGMAMPGDTLSDTAALKNTTDREAELFFHTSLPEELTDEQKDLLDQMNLVIALEGKELYRGSLGAETLNKDVSLGTYAAGAEKKLDFSVTVPSELKNRYALRDTAVRWVFSVQQDEAPGTPVKNRPKTGDMASTVLYLTLAGAGAALLIGCVVYRKKKKEGVR